MCTAAFYHTKDYYFGRNLDLDYTYDECITITPRSFPLLFRCGKNLQTHAAIMGVAYVVDGYPLYYDAINEHGLGIAGLRFAGNAVYKSEMEGKDNIASFEVIPWILAQCSSVRQARELFEVINITDAHFSDELSATPLHWMLADRSGACITVESVANGVKVYENPTGVLTNDPPFDYQMFYLNHFMQVSPNPPQNRFSAALSLQAYSHGMGGMGLPGDLSSSSRFVRAAFVRQNSVSAQTEGESVSQFFHILRAVEQIRGCVCLGDGAYEITVYSSCCNLNQDIYYYTTYENSAVIGVEMHREDLNSDTLISFPMIKEPALFLQNGPV